MESKVFNFSLRIDDDNGTLSEHQGLAIKYVGHLLIELDKALELNGKECTLSQISGNCYEMSYSTQNQNIHNNYVGLMTRVGKADLNDLPQNQRGLKRTLNSILGDNFYAIAFDTNKSEIIKFEADKKTEIKLEYYTSNIITGIITRIGSTDIDKQATIVVKEYDNDNTITIPVTLEQERNLIQSYKNGLVVLEVRYKKDLVNNKSNPHSLTSFRVKSDKKLNEEINKIIEKHGAIFNNLNYAQLYSNLDEQNDD